MKTPGTLKTALAAATILSAVFALWRGPILSDEVFSLQMAARGWGGMLAQLEGDVHPPLYYVLLRLWHLAAPAEAGWLRLFSLLWAASAVYIAARGRGFEPGLARPAAWMMAANPLVLYMACYGRMYTLLLFLCVLTLDLAVQIAEGRAGWRRTAALSAILCAGMLAHHWYVFFLAGLGIYLAMRARSGLWKLAAPAAGGALLYALLWGRAAAGQLSNRAEHLAWLARPGLAQLGEALLAHLWLAALGLLAVLLQAALAKPANRESREWRQSVAPAAAAAFIFVAPFVISQWKPVFNARFTIVAAPFVALALAPLLGRFAATCGAGALAAATVWLVLSGAYPPACNSREAARLLSGQARAGDTVIYCRLSRQPVEWYWQGRGVRGTSFPASIDGHPGYEGKPAGERLRAEAAALERSSPGRVFVVADTDSEPSRILLEAFNAARRGPARAHLSGASAGRHYFNRLLEYPASRLTPAGSPSGAPRE